MTDRAESGDNARVQSLEAEALAMRQQVALRDDLLKSLNRRLLQLERGEADPGEMGRIELRYLRDENAYLRRLSQDVGEENTSLRRVVESQSQQLQDATESLRRVVRSLLDMGIFRWTLPVRRLRRRIYARRQGSA